MGRPAGKVLRMKLERVPSRKTEQDIGAKHGSLDEIVLLIVLGIMILAAIFFHH